MNRDTQLLSCARFTQWCKPHFFAASLCTAAAIGAGQTLQRAYLTTRKWQATEAMSLDMLALTRPCTMNLLLDMTCAGEGLCHAAAFQGAEFSTCLHVTPWAHHDLVALRNPYPDTFKATTVVNVAQRLILCLVCGKNRTALATASAALLNLRSLVQGFQKIRTLHLFDAGVTKPRVFLKDLHLEIQKNCIRHCAAQLAVVTGWAALSFPEALVFAFPEALAFDEAVALTPVRFSSKNARSASDGVSARCTVASDAGCPSYVLASTSTPLAASCFCSFAADFIGRTAAYT